MGERAEVLNGAAQGRPRVVASGKSRVYRSFVTMEIIWTVEPGASDFRDWEGVVRDAVMSAEPPAWAGIGTVSEPEELRGETPQPQHGAPLAGAHSPKPNSEHTPRGRA